TSSLFYKAEDGIRDRNVTGVQTSALPISSPLLAPRLPLHPPPFAETMQAILPARGRARGYRPGAGSAAAAPRAQGADGGSPRCAALRGVPTLPAGTARVEGVQREYCDSGEAHPHPVRARTGLQCARPRPDAGARAAET